MDKGMDIFDSKRLAALKKNLIETVFEAQEGRGEHHDYNQQKRIMEEVKSGNVGGFLSVYEELRHAPYGMMAQNELRSAKNLCIAWITIFSQSAIEGGLNSEHAFTLMDGFVRQLEEVESREEAFLILRESGVHFAELVHQRKGMLLKKRTHLLVERCEKLIFSRLHEKITVKELAEGLSVNPDYLSRLFHEHLGVTIGDYIQREKVQLARNMLIYSAYSLEEIAYYLGFSSQSHFGRVFKRLMEMSPGIYRRRHGTSGSFVSGEAVEDWHHDKGA